jgi:hypothetical protein
MDAFSQIEPPTGRHLFGVSLDIRLPRLPMQAGQTLQFAEPRPVHGEHLRRAIEGEGDRVADLTIKMKRVA